MIAQTGNTLDKIASENLVITEADESCFQNIVRNPTLINEVKDVLASQEFKQTLNLIVQDSFKMQVNGKPPILTFWANNVQSKMEKGAYVAGKTEHHGLGNALRAQKEHEEFTTLADFEKAKAEMIKLDELERVCKDSKVLDAVCALQSLLFASSAQDAIAVSVNGAGYRSYFRAVELNAIMNNENIKSVSIISEDSKSINEDGFGALKIDNLIDKKTAFHKLRDEWLDSTILKHQKAVNDLGANTDDAKTPQLQEVLRSVSKALAEEQGLAEYMSKTPYPFTQNGLYAEKVKYDAQDQAKENERISKIKAHFSNLTRNSVINIDDIRQVNEHSVQATKDALSKHEMSNRDSVVWLGHKLVSALHNETKHMSDPKLQSLKVRDFIDYLKKSISTPSADSSDTISLTKTMSVFAAAVNIGVTIRERSTQTVGRSSGRLLTRRQSSIDREGTIIH